MARTGGSLRNVSSKIISAAFWAIFGVVAVLSFLLAPSLRYQYQVTTTLTTYSSVMQGLGTLLGAVALGVFLRKHRLDVDLAELEQRTLETLSTRYGWSIVAWTSDLEDRLLGGLPQGTVAAPVQAVMAPPPPGPEASQAAQGQRQPAGEGLEDELDDLLDTLSDQDDILAPSGGQQVVMQAQPQGSMVQQAEAQQGPVGTAGQGEADLQRAVLDHRAMTYQRRDLMRLMVQPVAMNAAIVGICAWAVPSVAGFLARDAVMNSALIFLSTYGSVVSVVFTAVAALRMARG